MIVSVTILQDGVCLLSFDLQTIHADNNALCHSDAVVFWQPGIV